MKKNLLIKNQSFNEKINKINKFSKNPLFLTIESTNLSLFIFYNVFVFIKLKKGGNKNNKSQRKSKQLMFEKEYRNSSKI